MKLRQLNSEIALYELRTELGNLLSESISDYLSNVIALLKNDSKVDLDQLAEFISGLKLLGSDEYRGSMTTADIGMNPNNFKELFQTLNSIPKNKADLPRATANVFLSLKTLAPSGFKKAREELKPFEDGSKSEKAQLIIELQKFATNVNKFFYKIKHGAVQPKDKQVTAEIGDEFDLVGGYPT